MSSHFSRTFKIIFSYSLSFPAEQQNSSCHQQYPYGKDPVFRSKILQHTKWIQLPQIFISCACGCDIIPKRDHISHDQVIGDCIGKDAESSECQDFRHCTEEIPAGLHLTIPGMHHTDVDKDKKRRFKETESDTDQIHRCNIRILCLHQFPQIPVLFR